jgi:hypothetical protein
VDQDDDVMALVQGKKGVGTWKINDAGRGDWGTDLRAYRVLPQKQIKSKKKRGRNKEEEDKLVSQSISFVVIIIHISFRSSSFCLFGASVD